MKSFTFRQRCRARGDYKVNEICEFISIVQELFNIDNFHNSDDSPVESSKEYTQSKLDALRLRNKRTRIGLIWDLFTIPPSRRDDSTLRIGIITGASPETNFIDSIEFDFGDTLLQEHLDMLVKSTQLFHPFESYISEVFNERALNAYARQKKIKGFRRPAIIRGWHFLDFELAQSVGGIDHCLNAPAHHVEKLGEGVIIQLCEGVFDPTSEQFLRVQENVMQYLGILDFSST